MNEAHLSFINQALKLVETTRKFHRSITEMNTWDYLVFYGDVKTTVICPRTDSEGRYYSITFKILVDARGGEGKFEFPSGMKNFSIRIGET